MAAQTQSAVNARRSERRNARPHPPAHQRTSKEKFMFRYICLLALWGLQFPLAAAADTPNITLTAGQRTSAIEGVLRCVRESYVFPEVAARMEAHVREKAARKEYDAIMDGTTLAEVLTRDLRAISEDLHLHVSFSPNVLPKEEQPGVMPPPGWL